MNTNNTANQPVHPNEPGNGGLWKVMASVMAGLLLTAGVLYANTVRTHNATVADLQQSLDHANAPKVVTATFALSRTRTGPTVLPRPKPGQWHALSVRATDGVEYSVHIENARQERVWSWSTLSMNTLNRGRLSVLIGHDTLVPGDYTLQLVQDSESTQAASAQPLAFTIR